MKRCILFLLLLALFPGLSACRSRSNEDYYSIRPHIAQTTPQPAEEEEPYYAVTNRTELRGAVLSFIRNWVEQGSIRVTDYQGDLAADLEDTIRYATQEDPIGAYAVDYMDGELSGNPASGSIQLNTVFRRSAAEIDAIVTVSGNSGAYSKIKYALFAYDTSLTLRIRNYQDADFSAYIRNYCLENPGQVLALPTVSAEVYPREGSTRILELHFTYPATRDEMREKQASVSTLLSSAASYIRSGESELEKAELLCRFLTTRFDYTVQEQAPDMPAYSLLCEGKAHSLSFASVFYGECSAANIDCRIVTGTRQGAEHYWNLLSIDGVYYHVDLMGELEQGSTRLQLRYAAELRNSGYVWKEEDYPPAAESPNGGAVPPSTTEPTTAPENGG